MNFTRNNPRRLESFLLLSVLLHVALLYAIRIPARHFSPPVHHPLAVSLAAAPAAVPSHPPAARQRSTGMLTGTGNVAPSGPAHQPDAAPGQTLVESSLTIAQTEGTRSEQQLAALEKTRQATPAGVLEQYMRIPHRELQLANGVRKIITDAGAVCFQPVPLFARDQAGLFGIPVTCP